MNLLQNWSKIASSMQASYSVIITTSPNEYCPYLYLLRNLLASCSLVSDDVHIICDGYKLGKKALKSGIVDEAETYIAYKQNIQKEFAPLYNITEHTTRNGFAKNIKLALEQVKYDVVLVLQHDYLFHHPIDFGKLTQQYFVDADVNYLGFHCPVNYCNKKQSFYDAEADIIPLDFWYDKPHLARKSFYQQVVFKWPCRNFIEDSFGQRMKRDILQNNNYQKYKAFLLNIPQLLTHTNGRKLKNKIMDFDL
jgi:hypothetical protein